MKTTLQTIIEKFSNVQFNEDNYSIGGGLADNNYNEDCPFCGHESGGHYVGCPRPRSSKFASKRHEDAKCDAGKLTLGEATQLFKRATKLEIGEIKEIIDYALPSLEWHHAGKLPKAYGGGMKKTYFLNSNEIVDLAKNFDIYKLNLEALKSKEKIHLTEKEILRQKREAFLKEHGKKFTRITNLPKWHIVIEREMNGKYGWFDSTYKSYNLPEYYTGYEFESEEKLIEFNNL